MLKTVAKAFKDNGREARLLIWNFPGGNPYPVLDCVNAALLGMATGANASDPWCAEDPLKPEPPFMTWLLRQVYRVLTLWGILEANTIAFWGMIYLASAGAMITLWSGFLVKHLYGYFSANYVLLPDAWQDFGALVLTTIMLLAVPGFVEQCVFMYQTTFKDEEQRVARQAFRDMVAEKRKHDPYAASDDWEFYSVCGQPLRQYKYFELKRKQSRYKKLRRRLLRVSKDKAAAYPTKKHDEIYCTAMELQSRGCPDLVLMLKLVMTPALDV